jgi:hypothetical protein
MSARYEVRFHPMETHFLALSAYPPLANYFNTNSMKRIEITKNDTQPG